MAAAYTTLKRGYSGYIVLVQAPADQVHEVGEPRTARRARLAGETEEFAVILMMRSTDADYEKAVDARKALGPQWSSIVGREFPTMCGEPRA